MCPHEDQEIGQRTFSSEKWVALKVNMPASSIVSHVCQKNHNSKEEMTCMYMFHPGTNSGYTRKKKTSLGWCFGVQRNLTFSMHRNIDLNEKRNTSQGVQGEKLV